MNETWVLDLARSSLQTAMLVGGPLLAIALLVGLLVSIFQALTQINEATLTFIPKILAIGGALLILGPWMIRVMTSYTTSIFESIPVYLR